MYNTSVGYKTAIDLSGRVTKVDLDFGDVNVSSTNVLSYFRFLDALIADEKSGLVGSFPARSIKADIIANQAGYTFDPTNRSFLASASLWVAGAFEEVPFGTFYIKSAPLSNSKDEINLEAMDAAVLFDKPYVLDATWPMTVHDWASAICSAVGVTLGSTSWHNSTLELAEEPYVGGSFRDAIKIIAQAGGCFAKIGRDDKLYFNIPTIVARDLQEVFDHVEDGIYGPVNALVLTKDPTNDNVGIKDQVSIDANGLTEIQIDSNPILETDREGLIGDLFAVMSGLTFKINTVEYTGDPSLDAGDVIQFLDKDSALQDLVILSTLFEHTGAWSGTIKSLAPSKSDIETDWVGDNEKRLLQVGFDVNKLDGTINAIAGQLTIQIVD